ncbi:MAG: geranylgeranylglyceryl/heptaprenylglyceryl phosphate synthase [Bacteroidales bacterium]|nr:geranylgeranylglyceryl/heptaprenylglyceryl phosphate synthase [Bacteroidales bacterium]
MKDNFYRFVIDSLRFKKLFAVLIDPGKINKQQVATTVKTAEIAEVDFYLVGGSLVTAPIEDTIKLIKSLTHKPVVLFPGSYMQVCAAADGILFLSLVSGRNPEYLIGNHVLAAPTIRDARLEAIPTGYILIEGQATSTTEYISNTKPIPANKPDIVVATAMASEMLGHKLVYLEGGSGASSIISKLLIQEVKQHINIPLMVGGGIRSANDLDYIFRAGADIAIVGNAIEENAELTLALGSVSRKYTGS